jgi:hypothetical protein
MSDPRYRYIGETPVTIPDLAWGGDDDPVMPGDISEPYPGEVSSEVLVPVGSAEEKDWLKTQAPPPVVVDKAAPEKDGNA